MRFSNTAKNTMLDGEHPNLACQGCREWILLAERNAALESNKRLRNAVALLNSMILSGEDHSDTSRQAVREALS